jgi:PAS domain S-box-containing protein
MERPTKAALRISGIYALVGGLWIILSDRLLSLLVYDRDVHSRFEILKGWFFILVTATVLMITIRRWFSILFREMTERRRIHEELREKDEMYRILYENAFDGVLLTVPDGRILAANPAACAMLGRTEKDLCTLGRTALVDHSDPKVIALFEQRRQRGKASGVLELRRGDGSLFPAEISSTLFRGSHGETLSSMAMRDISVRRQAEQMVLRERDFSNAVIDSLPGIFFICNEAMELLRWNRRAEQVLGYRAEQMLNLSSINLFGKPDRPFVREQLREAFVTGIIAIEATIEDAGGRTTPYFFSGERIRIEETACIVCFGVDISIRKQAEREVHQSAERLRKLSNHLQTIREAERTAIAREIHDELGQSLTGIKLDISWIAQRLPEGNNPLRERCAAAESLIDNTVTSVQRISHELRPGMLDELGLAAAIEWQGAEFQKRTDIQCDVSGVEEVEVESRRAATALFRIFQETLTNVARHSGATGITVSLAMANSEIMLAVNDNGKGIPDALLDAPSSIGLLGMHERALAVGGTVSIAGKPGAGTSVIVRVPAGGEKG